MNEFLKILLPAKMKKNALTCPAWGFEGCWNNFSCSWTEDWGGWGGLVLPSPSSKVQKILKDLKEV